MRIPTSLSCKFQPGREAGCDTHTVRDAVRDWQQLEQQTLWTTRRVRAVSGHWPAEVPLASPDVDQSAPETPPAFKPAPSRHD